MPKAYWVTTYREIKDPAKLAAYAKLAPIALAPFGVEVREAHNTSARSPASTASSHHAIGRVGGASAAARRPQPRNQPATSNAPPNTSA